MELQTNPATHHEISLQIQWTAPGVRRPAPSDRLERSLQLTWEEIIAHLCMDPKKRFSQLGLCRRFGNSLADTFRHEIQGKSKTTVSRVIGSLDPKSFELLLTELQTRGFIKKIPTPQHLKIQAPYYILTEKGEDYLTP